MPLLSWERRCTVASLRISAGVWDTGRSGEGGIISRRIESGVAEVMQKVGVRVAALVSDFAWASWLLVLSLFIVRCDGQVNVLCSFGRRTNPKP